jgi:hypothetical protein
MIQLTDELIRTAFVKTGFDEKYFVLFKEDLIRRYNELQHDCPDDEETPENVSNIIESIRQSEIYITFFIQEIEKGHSENWASAYAENRISTEDETDIVKEAYYSIEDKEKREKDLDIYINSLSDDIIFRERYKYLFHDGDFYPREKAAEYCEIYHRCINAGKSTIYSHAFANEANNYFDERGTHYNEHFVDIHAEAVEQAIEHNMNEGQAYSFGECCSDVCTNGSWWMTSNYLNEYHEDWQKEFFLYLANKDYKHYKKCDMPEDELNELRHEIYK